MQYAWVAPMVSLRAHQRNGGLQTAGGSGASAILWVAAAPPKAQGPGRGHPAVGATAQSLGAIGLLVTAGHLQGRVRRRRAPRGLHESHHRSGGRSVLNLSGLHTVRRAAEGQENWTRRDQLLEIEEEVQKVWEEQGAYISDAPPATDEGVSTEPKFFVTFPYPYMNGRLHLGHTFSLTKSEFAARFARLDGKRVLFPFAFHCTGMPIAAAAMRLEKELAAKAESKQEREPELVTVGASAESSQASDGEVAFGVFKGSKSKVKAKTGGMGQYDIMRALKIDDGEIPRFTDPQYWLEYFPPLAIQDLKKLGVAVDWRRSFITTDVNKYYDAFIRWQFLKLRSKYLGAGNRASIFSIETGQPCADHDRAEGEGVNPMEYTLIKLRVKEVPAEWSECLGNRDVFLVAATLRPETMYGQTNCFVLPEGEYGFFQMTNGEVFVCSQRSALNMCYQGLGDSQEMADGTKGPVCLLEKTGKDLLGLPLEAPLAVYDTVYALPMLTISMNKGTGIVTSVPADSPDDFACLNDWKTRANWREQYGIDEAWCESFDVVEIIEIPDTEFGSAAAPYLCEKMKIGSHKEKDKLAAAKKEVYMKGFYSGVLKVGPYAGQKVMDVKQLVRDELIEKGQAAIYYEPESQVIARSGDECIVAMCDQWYLKYSDEDWTKRVSDHVEKELNAFNTAAHNNLSYAVGWLGDWACSRTFGLGTKLPWDEKWLIESLSDSTVYMAYYTIAHILQGGGLRGDMPGLGNIEPEDLTEEVFDYIFCITDNPPAETNIALEVLHSMRNEFSYWYPLDLRCSGKDLINNHLTMSLFNHAAVWESPSFWPRGIYCNGHVMVDSEKMSKSKGNFISLDEAISSYSSDATRIACADSGDGLEDANFSRETARKMILRLTTLKSWMEETVSQLSTLRSGPLTFLDDIFQNEITACVLNAHAGYTQMMYSDALRAVFYDMENLRSQYSILANADIHREVIQRFMEVQMIVLSPIAPHFCEHMWRTALQKPGLVVHQRWPSPETPVDEILLKKYSVIQNSLRTFRLELDKMMTPKKKKKKANNAPPVKPTHGIIFVARSYKPWQQEVLRLLQKVELNDENEPMKSDFMRGIKDADALQTMSKKETQQAMSFASAKVRQEVKVLGKEALALELPFDEGAILRDLEEAIKRQLGLQSIEITDASQEHPKGDVNKQASAVPGKPLIMFYAETS